MDIGRNLLHAAAAVASPCMSILLPSDSIGTLPSMMAKSHYINNYHYNNEKMSEELQFILSSSRKEILTENQKKLAGLIEAEDIIGATPLITAIRQNAIDVVDMLLKSGASANARGTSSGTNNRMRHTPQSILSPLHAAAAYTYGDSIEHDVRQQQGDDNSGLAIVQLLLENGGEVDAVDENNKVARQVALDVGNLKTAEFLASWARNSYFQDDKCDDPRNSVLIL